jgi:Mediator complex subunit MED14
MPAEPVTLSRALATLKSLNTLLHLRLTLHEVIPLPLSNYTIANGKVTFSILNEWQLIITIDDEFGKWSFVDIKDHIGNDVGEASKRGISQVLNDAFEQCKIEYGLFPMGVTEESLRSMNKKAPLVEVYNILRMYPWFLWLIQIDSISFILCRNYTFHYFDCLSHLDFLRIFTLPPHRIGILWNFNIGFVRQ